MTNILRKHGYSVPDDVMLLGFDDSPNASLFTPTISTVHIHSQHMGTLAMTILLSRIKAPDYPFGRLYVDTDLILRESSGDL